MTKGNSMRLGKLDSLLLFVLCVLFIPSSQGNAETYSNTESTGCINGCRESATWWHNVPAGRDVESALITLEAFHFWTHNDCDKLTLMSGTTSTFDYGSCYTVETKPGFIRNIRRSQAPDPDSFYTITASLTATQVEWLNQNHKLYVGLRGPQYLDITGWPAYFYVTTSTLKVTFKANIQISPQSHIFGETYTGNSSAARTFTVSNKGSVNITIGVIAFEFAGTSDFSLQYDKDFCSGKTIAPSGNCTFNVIFSPTSEGLKEMNLLVPSSDPETLALTVPLKGTGIRQYIITASAGKGGGISPSGNVAVDPGADQGFSITPDTFYYVDDVVVDGSSAGPVRNYAFSDVKADHTIEATFAGKIFETAAGKDHNLALKSDGSLWAWGENQNGQLGDGTDDRRNTAVRIGNDTDWTAIAAGHYHSLALKSDGSLWAWGYNQFGQLGDGTTTTRNEPVRIGGDTDWAAIAAGRIHTLAVKSDGSLWAWGSNYYGQLGDGTTINKTIPTQIGSDFNWKEISAGGFHSIALKTDGKMWAWGNNLYGQLGNGMNTDSKLPLKIGSSAEWVEVAAGVYHNVELRSDGSLWAWGNNSYGQLGNGENIAENIPVRIGNDSDWTDISAGSYHSIALKTDRTMWAWGSNYYGQLGDGTITYRNVPTRTGSDADWVSIAAGDGHSLAQKKDGTLWAWGYNQYGQLGDGMNTYRGEPLKITDGTDWSEIAAGGLHNIALKTDRTMWAWGRNDYGQLGDVTTTNRGIPVKIGSDANWKVIAAGIYHTAALKTDGTLWTWGRNSYGQLGDGTSVSRSNPGKIGSDTDWTAVAAGNFHTVALKSDGSLWAWGNNLFGQLGEGTTTDKNIPTRIGDDIDWKEIDAGSHTLALKSGGTLWAWGYNQYGQLGDGTTVNRNTPVRIGNDADWVGITAQYAHSMALRSDGTLWGWGANDYGQVGDGTNEEKHTPVRIESDIDWMSVDAGYFNTVALKSDSTLWIWGSASHGQLGDQITANRNVPARMNSDQDWKQIDSGEFHVLALKSDGSLWSWGDNQYGQLGNGAFYIEKLPVMIAVELHVIKTGSGSGVVTAEPAGVTCGTDCSETYFHGTVATLTAVPDEGSLFSGWTGGGCAGTGECITELNTDTTITAIFTLVSIDGDKDNLPDNWEIANNLDPNDNGSINPDNGANGDPDNDSHLNFDEYKAGSNPQSSDSRPVNLDVHLFKGFNLFGYPVTEAAGLKSYDLLSMLGSSEEIEKILVFDKEAERYEVTYYEVDVPAGANVDIDFGKGITIYAKVEKTISFNPDVRPLNSYIECDSVTVSNNTNVTAFPCAPPGYTVYQLLSKLSGSIVSSISRFNPDTGKFEAACYVNGQPSGVDFPIEAGEGYFIYMKGEKSGFKP